MSSKFTVLIDVYWGFAFFQKALEGIQNQTYQNLEIIIANNGANDEITQFINNTSKELNGSIEIKKFIRFKVGEGI